MPAYPITEHVFTDAARFDDYRTQVGLLFARFGGRYLTKAGSHHLPEGGHWAPGRVVTVESPDRAALEAWYRSPEVQPLIALRKDCTSEPDLLITVDGATPA